MIFDFYNFDSEQSTGNRKTWARISAAGERMWDLFFTEVLNLEILNF